MNYTHLENYTKLDIFYDLRFNTREKVSCITTGKKKYMVWLLKTTVSSSNPSMYSKPIVGLPIARTSSKWYICYYYCFIVIKWYTSQHLRVSVKKIYVKIVSALDHLRSIGCRIRCVTRVGNVGVCDVMRAFSTSRPSSPSTFRSTTTMTIIITLPSYTHDHYSPELVYFRGQQRPQPLRRARIRHLHKLL